MKQATLRFKIYGGVAIIACLLITNALVSFFGQKRLRAELKLLRNVDLINDSVHDVDRDVQKLKLSVDRYVAFGHESLYQEVNRIRSRLDDEIEDINAADLDTTFESLFEQVGQHIKTYSEQFELMVEERRIREDLVQVQMPKSAAMVETSLSQLGTKPELQSETFQIRVFEVQGHFARAEKSFLRYFESRDAEHVSAAVESLRNAFQVATEIQYSKGADAHLLSKMKQFEQVAMRAFQATRGYLFFQNVLMSGEASEVSYYSRKLNDYAEQQNSEISERVRNVSEFVNWLIASVTIVAVALSSIMAVRLAILVVPPITELTEVFTQLSEGETVPEVPGTDRADEIGQMAEAARVFSDQNRHTQDLLEESKELGKELREKARQLQVTNEELDNFAYVASHDLKSPLRGIRQLATWIEEEDAKNLSKESVTYLEHLRSRITKMEVLLEDLLEFSRVGQIELLREQVELIELLDEVVELSNNPKSVRVDFERERITLFTWRVPLRQILQNLVGNAIKHHHCEGEAWVKVSFRADDKYYRFEVSDNGPGIREKDHQRVFQMYQRVGNAKIDGSGMGLSIVKKQIEKLGGSISLSSEFGIGSTFRFTIPKHQLEG